MASSWNRVETPLIMAACGDPKRILGAGDRDAATVGHHDAGDDLDEGGLARPVLAEERVHLARAHVEVHRIEDECIAVAA